MSGVVAGAGIESCATPAVQHPVTVGVILTQTPQGIFKTPKASQGVAGVSGV